MKIWLMRHAESLFNIGASNEKDVGLSENGKIQASSVEKEIEIVICSPLRRCRETLQYSQIKYQKLIIDPLVREMKIDTSDFLADEDEIVETEQDMMVRVELFKNRLRKYKESTILVITHSDFIWYLTSYLYGNERYGKYTRNAEIIESL